MFVIYGFDDCPYCVKAKALLDKEGKPYIYQNVSNDAAVRTKWMDGMGFKDGHRTFPRVYKDGKLIGGYSDLENHILFS